MIWIDDFKMSRNWIKLKALRNVLSTNYQKGILDILVDKKREGNKHYNFVVHKFVLDYLEGLNVNKDLKIQELTSLKNTNSLPSRKNNPKIQFPKELYDRFINSFLVRFRHM